MRLILAALVFSAFSYAQTFSLGVIGGAPFTDVVHNGYVAPITTVVNSSNFTIGPALQLSLPLGLRIELDALYRPYGFKLYNQLVAALSNPGASVSGQRWSFPLLLQYRFPFPVIKPYLEVGPSFEHLTGANSVAGAFTGPGKLLHSSDTGIVLGGGVEAKIILVRVSAELRYTRESLSNFSSISNLNQAEVLFGIHF